MDEAISVHDCISLISKRLGGLEVRVLGEIGEVSPWKELIFFSLRDKEQDNTIECMMTKSDCDISGVKLEDGAEIIISGYPSVLKRSGKLKLIAKTIELVGEGALRKRYEELKKKLTKEGLFEEERKRPIPEYPHKIGLITSKTGAVIHDFESNLGNFGFQIKIIDSRVEGQPAIQELLSAIETMSKQDIDVLVIIRGGGSFESLMAFDNEILVKAVANFKVPVIAGIGHHKDIPLLALVADAMESTPTATAYLLNESWNNAKIKLEQHERNIFSTYRYNLTTISASLGDGLDVMLSIMKKTFSVPMRIVHHTTRNIFTTFAQGLEEYWNLMHRTWSYGVRTQFTIRFDNVNRDIKEYTSIISIADPSRQFSLGYSVIRKDNKIIKNTSDVKIGDDINIQVKDGDLSADINKINKRKYHGRR